MGLIPENIIGEIRQRADIVAVIGRHVQLRKSGRNHKGLCPFHQERGPSFNVNGDKGFFYCFGCQKKGDVFTFVMEYEGKSFLEAAETLAELTGVVLPERSDDPAVRRAMMEQKSERSQLLRVNQAAASFFRSRLRDPAGAAARDYLAERGVTPEVADRFLLGYAPDEWSGLADFLAGEKLPLTSAEALGLVAPRRSGGSYDRFRHRLVCPVMQTGGEVVGFSARALPGGETNQGGEGQAPAKYINSPESALYKKGKLLYGVYQARDAIRLKERAILVEGNFDVVSLHQAGFAEAVAPLGTALTEEQVELLRRLTGRVVLFYDGDRAGRAATLKALRLLVAAEIQALIAELPAGEDPDSLARRGGAAALTQVVARAKPGVNYFMDHVWSPAASTGSSDEYARAVREAAELLPSVKDELGRRHLVDHFAAVMNVGIERLRSDLRSAYRGRAPSEAPPDSRVATSAGSAPGSRPSGGNQVSTTSPPNFEEMDLLALLGQYPELFAIAEELDVLSLLTDAGLQDMYSAARGGQPLWTCIPLEISPEIAEHVLAGAKRPIAHPERSLREAVANLRAARSRAEREVLLKQMEQARIRGNHELARELLERARELRR
ncbi:MAG TPA: DNA primase [Kofleriaceae bacterium]|nr:DNA primase [Kofleriaceae bacterium]